MKQLLAWTGSAGSTITSEGVMAMAEKFNTGQEVYLQTPARVELCKPSLGIKSLVQADACNSTSRSAPQGSGWCSTTPFIRSPPARNRHAKPAPEQDRSCRPWGAAEVCPAWVQV